MPWGYVAAGVIGAIGSNMAASKQASGQEAAANTQQNMFNTVNAQEQPFIQGGYGAENALLYGLGLGGTNSMPMSSMTNPGQWTVGPGGSIVPQIAAPGGSNAFGVPYSMMGPGGMGAPSMGGGVPLNQVGTPSFGAGYFTQQFTPQDFLNNVDPGFQFQLQTGGQAIRNADTPGVGALSGPALKDLMTFNQGLAGTTYQNAFNRFTTQQNNIFARLSQIAGLGQSAATQVGNAGTSLGTGIAQAQAGAAASQAAGIVGATNSLGSAIPLAYLASQNNNNQVSPGVDAQLSAALNGGS